MSFERFARVAFATITAVQLASSTADAQTPAACAIDTAPAATLLLPYFEVNLARPQGMNTIFTINNASSAAVLAHLTFWSDLSVPTLDFNVYLTGFDAETFDLRRLFTAGVLPRNASDGQDPADTISPQGPFSQDLNFASCTAQLPLPTLSQTLIDHIRAAHTGQSSAILNGKCVGRNYGDRVVRGYVTIDTVNNCTLRFPTDEGYFGPGGDATDQNVLFGDVLYVDAFRGRAVESNLVPIQAFASHPETSTTGSYTFYGRYVGWSGADHREPLPTNFALRYNNRAPSTTDVLVWRDSKVSAQPFTCGTTPAGFPRPNEEIVAFDDQENAFELTETPFGFEAQRVRVDGATLPIPFDRGWLYLNLNAANSTAGSVPPEDAAAAQAWVTQWTDVNGRYRVGSDAWALDNACDASHTAARDGGPIQP